MDTIKAAAAFKLWMDEYINDPKAFEDTTASVLQHLKERNDGAEPSYGESCAATLEAYVAKCAERGDFDGQFERGCT